MPAPAGKRRPWLPWILYPLLLIPVSIPVLLVVSVAFSLLTTDRAHREGMQYAGELQVIRSDLRQHFREHPDDPARTLEELASQHIFSTVASLALQRYPHEFVPFSPATPDSAVVLTVHGRRAQPDRFTKHDLTAGPSTPDPFFLAASPTPAP